MPNKALFAAAALLALVAGAMPACGRSLHAEAPTPAPAPAPDGGSEVYELEWGFPSALGLTAYPTITLKVGDAVTFTWNGMHDVWRVPEAACPSAFDAGAGSEEIAPPSSGGTTTVLFDTPGAYHFACSIGNGGHCSNGMLVSFEVEA
ncbi:uclacyanin 3 [Chlorella sorokiniana]|uniref:Uclacyanin 3 n=1 Tax=Chlorella sorokiniana TaxID=3076 RepID=A0A2P6TV34_CHLSO|nr:uclacyanin 3 [Chlorella sorokiniana]|eukprot:PRW57933.1 uclacyanin 3 [Chlorella sorokiniana]